MDTQKTIVSIAVGLALAVAGYFVVRKVLDSQSAVDTSGTTVINQPSLPTYTADSTQFSPIGAIKNTSGASAPPGVDPDQLSLATVKAPDLPASLPVNLGTAGANSPPQGTAVQPTDGHSSAPALSGNAALVDAEYLKLFGRHAEDAGLQLWTKELNNGNINPADLEKRLIVSAQNSDIGAAAINQPGLVLAAYK